ncbi:PA2169 family four-helix-bundle protein [Roseivirga sp. BDSF3-8]|uniref:ferritin-like domain-containing protein n=1 Tax=Roseivirga sp. BDSF3-8 TaxID=3241598 RepID=UPI00353255A3
MNNSGIDNNKAVSMLNDLLTRNYDAEKGYQQAADEVDDTRLKTFFHTKAKERYDFGHTIKDEIRNLGGSPDKGTSIKGDMHRAWMDLRESIASHDEKAILEECERGEKAALKDYNDLLNNGVPMTTKSVIERQRDSIQRDLREIQDMEVTYTK